MCKKITSKFAIMAFVAVFTLTAVPQNAFAQKLKLTKEQKREMQQIQYEQQRAQLQQSFVKNEKLPCQSTDSKTDYIVVSGEGKSSDRAMAADKAYLNALEKLAAKLNAIAAKETKRVAIDRNDNANTKTVNTGKLIADANVSGYRTACEEYVTYGDGKFGCFVTIEFNKQKIVKEMYNEMKLDREFDKYMKEFDEDLKEYEQGK